MVSFMPIMCCNNEGLRGSLGQKDRGILGFIDIYKIASMLIVQNQKFYFLVKEGGMENGKVDKLKEFHSNTCTHHRDKSVNYSFWSITIISVFILRCWKKNPLISAKQEVFLLAVEY